MHLTMRPLDFGELLDGSFTLLRRNFGAFFGVAFLPQLPLVVLWLLAPLLIGGSAELATLLELLMTPYGLLVAVLTMGALTEVAAIAYSGGTPQIGPALRRGFARFMPLLVASILVWFMFAVGLVLLVVPALIVLAMFFAVVPAIMLEDRGAIAALRRSRELSRGARKRIVGTILLAWLITMLPPVAMWMIAGVSAGMAGAGDMLAAGAGSWAMAVLQAAGIVVSAVTWPFIMIVTVLLYTDRRARTEATDLEEAADTLLATGR